MIEKQVAKKVQRRAQMKMKTFTPENNPFHTDPKQLRNKR